FFNGSHDQLQAQIRTILEDHSMFDFLCERTFDSYDVQGSGAVTLPTVAPMIQNILRSLDQPVSSDAVYSVWKQHCDPEMHNMTLSHFRPFVRSLFQDYLRDSELKQRQPAVTRPEPTPLPVARQMAQEPAQVQLPVDQVSDFQELASEAVRLSPKAARGNSR
ncbi:unnamed protein product, partial [Polarella glacialis]